MYGPDTLDEAWKVFDEELHQEQEIRDREFEALWRRKMEASRSERLKQEREAKAAQEREEIAMKEWKKRRMEENYSWLADSYRKFHRI